VARAQSIISVLRADPNRWWLLIAMLAGTGTFLGGVLGQLLHIDGGRVESYFGILVLATAFIAVVSGIASCTGWGPALAAAGAVMAIGGGAEIFGLYGWNGWMPFGRYVYTDWWLPYVVLPGGKLYPLLLPLTWFLIVSLWFLLMARRLSGWRLVLATGLFVTLTDVALEPVLTRVVLFWRWLEPTPFFGAPYANPVSWLVIATLAAACLDGLGIRRAHSIPHLRWMVPAALVFTAILGLVYGEERGALALVLLPVVAWSRMGSDRVDGADAAVKT
jgi:uncharacterized membrane protein